VSASAAALSLVGIEGAPWPAGFAIRSVSVGVTARCELASSLGK
jgi:hypothetical protein